MSFLTTVVAFLLALGVLIVFHEFGHYIVARWCGVKVLRFSVGFGAPLWRRRLGRDGTEWAIGAFPIGGYVKMLDEREGPVAHAELHRAFNRQNVWRRIAIVSAGPLANFLLAILLYWVLYAHGIPGVRPAVETPQIGTPAAAAAFRAGDLIRSVDGVPVQTWQELRWSLLDKAVEGRTVVVEVEGLDGNLYARRLDLGRIDSESLDADFLAELGIRPYQPPLPAVVGKILSSGAAAKAGLEEGDRIVAIDAHPIQRWDDLVTEVRKRPDQLMTVTVLRDGRTLNLTMTPAAEEEGGETIGRIGIGPRTDPEAMKRYITEVRYPFFRAATEAVRKTWEASTFTLEMIWKMVIGRVSIKNLSGPLTIADYAGQSAQLGWLPYVSFVALVSISLGVLNLLPVPLLDGGHLMYYSVEIIKGRPVSERALEIGQRVGVVLLFSLMAFAIYNDIQRLVGGS
ncbi:MAG: RIP metalloprotease RseP [Betaproteobacteria bacterium]|nr:RIP metalloprotease RseP [Betaproteobacteria bacterium]